MLVEDTDIEGVKVITPAKFNDECGFVSEVHNELTWEKAGLRYRFVQDNHSLTIGIGVIRGLHFQTHPAAQDKLVQVARGRILDVAVDLRRSSPTFGHHVAVELSAENCRQLLIPIGFAHGFCTMELNTEILYKVTNFYSAANDRGLAFDDPDLNIAWPVSPDRASVSDRDRQWPRLRDLVDTFA